MNAASERTDFDVPYGGILDAIRLYPFTVAISTIVLALAGVALGYAREPTYTASSQILVGNLSTNDPSALPGAVGASLALASVYPQLITADQVSRNVDRATKDVDGTATVDATQVIESPLIEVTAESDSEEAALAYANAAGRAMAAYVNQLESPGGDVKPIQEEYRAAQLTLAERQDELNRLEDRLGPDFSESEQAQVNEAEADVETAKLERNALGVLYQQGRDIEVSQPSLNLFKTAVDASSDRASSIQVAGLVGLIAGFVLGTALATFRANRWAERTT